MHALYYIDLFNFPSSRKDWRFKSVYLELNSEEPGSFKFVKRVFLSGSIVYYFLQEHTHDSSLGKQFASFYQKVSNAQTLWFRPAFLGMYTKTIIYILGRAL